MFLYNIDQEARPEFKYVTKTSLLQLLVSIFVQNYVRGDSNLSGFIGKETIGNP